MSYTPVMNNLTKGQAIQNLKAVVTAAYFANFYEYGPHSRLTSDIIAVQSIGGFKHDGITLFTVFELTDTVVALLDAVETRGVLYDAHLQLQPSEQRKRDLRFEDKMYEHDIVLPLTFSIRREDDRKFNLYTFSVFNRGFESSFLEENHLKKRDARTKLKTWYQEVDENLRSILPYPWKGKFF